MFILGQTLNPFKRVYYALLKYDGIGLPTAIRICNAASIHAQCHVRELNEVHVEKLRVLLHEHLEGQKQARLIKAKRARARIDPIRPASSAKK